MLTLAIAKLHGLGNDFVLIDSRRSARRQIPTLTPALCRAIANRKTGVGFDQLLVLRDARNKKVQATADRRHAGPHTDAALDILNADGSVAEMCGNGLRAAALYIWIERSRSGSAVPPSAIEPLLIDTCAGPRMARPRSRIAADTHTAVIECEMGVPVFICGAGRFARSEIARSEAFGFAAKSARAIEKEGLSVAGKTFNPVCVDVGNPHAVNFVYPQKEADLTKWGSAIERHRFFPNRTNVEFARVRGRHALDVKVWERGVGTTEACGTGAVASAVAAIVNGSAQSPVKVRFPGGEALVEWQGTGASAYLTGPATLVFTGDLRL